MERQEHRQVTKTEGTREKEKAQRKECVNTPVFLPTGLHIVLCIYQKETERERER